MGAIYNPPTANMKKCYFDFRIKDRFERGQIIIEFYFSLALFVIK